MGGIAPADNGVYLHMLCVVLAFGALGIMQIL